MTHCRVEQDLNRFFDNLTAEYEAGEYEQEVINWVDDTMGDEGEESRELCWLALAEAEDKEINEVMHDLTTIEARGFNTVDTMPNYKVQALARAALAINKLIERRLEGYKTE